MPRGSVAERWCLFENKSLRISETHFEKIHSLSGRHSLSLLASEARRADQNNSPRSCRLLFRNLGAFLASLGEANRDGLLAAFHLSAFAPFAGTKGAFLSSVHCALSAFGSRLAILASAGSLARTRPVLSCHRSSHFIRRAAGRGSCA